MAKTWAEIIAQAEKRGRFTDAEREMVWDFTKCATSEYIGRFREATWGVPGIPASQRLSHLSSGFSGAVNRNDIPKAKSIHGRIVRYFKRPSRTAGKEGDR